MTVNSPQYLVSVADAIVRDTTADAIAFKGTALIQSAFNQTMSSQEIRAGFGAGLQYIYNHSKKLDISIESGTFDESFICANNGAAIVNGLQNYYIFDEVVTLSSGAGSVAATPVGNLYVQPISGGIIQTITPSGKNFNVSGGGNNQYKVSYRYSATVDRITIDAGSVPNAYELTLRSKVFSASGQTAELMMTIPQWKITGNYQLQFTSAGVSSSKMDGTALINPADNALAYVDIRPVGNANITYTAIAAAPASVSLSSTTTTAQLTVYGIRGGVYSNVNVTNGCTFTSSATSIATVNGTGTITRVAAGTSYITVTHTASGLTDTVAVTCS